MPLRKNVEINYKNYEVVYNREETFVKAKDSSIIDVIIVFDKYGFAIKPLPIDLELDIKRKLR